MVVVVCPNFRGAEVQSGSLRSVSEGNPFLNPCDSETVIRDWIERKSDNTG